jgi:DNA replication protein DnaC
MSLNNGRSTLVTSNLPFAEWTEVRGSERLIGALLTASSIMPTSSI